MWLLVITHACDYPEVKEYDVGEIVTGDSTQISNVILKILSDKLRLKQMSENAKRVVLEKFQLKV